MTQETNKETENGAEMVGRIINNKDGGSLSHDHRVVVGCEDGILETERAGRPSLCMTCGRSADDMSVVSHDWDASESETWLHYECKCGDTTRVGARQEGSSRYYNVAPEWESKLIEEGWTDAELGTIAPFYYVYGTGEGLDSHGLLAGPLPSFRTAVKVAQRFSSLNATIDIAREDEPKVAECHLCGKKMVPGRAGTRVDSNGDLTKYECGPCFKQEFRKVFEALSDVHETDVGI